MAETFRQCSQICHIHVKRNTYGVLSQIFFYIFFFYRIKAIFWPLGLKISTEVVKTAFFASTGTILRESIWMKFPLFSQYRTMNEIKSDLCSKLSGGIVEIAFSASRGIFSWKSFFSYKDFCLIHFGLWAKEVRPFDVSFSVGRLKLLLRVQRNTVRINFLERIFLCIFWTLIETKSTLWKKFSTGSSKLDWTSPEIHSAGTMFQKKVLQSISGFEQKICGVLTKLFWQAF